MSIKYADITIIRNIESESIFRSFTRYMGYENYTSDLDTIIIKFDDNTICDTKDEYIDKKFEFGAIRYDGLLPIYFEFKSKGILFLKTPHENDNVKKLNFKPIFNGLENHKNIKFEPSIFNMIYEDCFYKEKFAICRIKSNEEKPRFILAYDDTLLDRSTIIYLIDYLFKHRFL